MAKVQREVKERNDTENGTQYTKTAALSESGQAIPVRQSIWTSSQREQRLWSRNFTKTQQLVRQILNSTASIFTTRRKPLNLWQE